MDLEIKNNDNQLVSIIVVTYNSSAFVLETLESAKNQTYKNIELIISDDCSSDDTVLKCKEWIAKNGNRFVHTNVLTVDKNTGISMNLNRGLQASQGEWLKFIAGDDVLLETCIATNITIASENNASFYFSKMRIVPENENMVNYFQNGFDLFSEGKKQYPLLLKANYLPAPTSFMNKKTLLELGGLNVKFPMLDDYPLWIKATKKGYRLYISDIETVIYRVHSQSISNQQKILKQKEFYSNVRYLKSWYSFQITLIKDQFLHGFVFLACNNLIEILQFKTMLLCNNKRNVFSVSLYNIFTILKPSLYIKKKQQ